MTDASERLNGAIVRFSSDEAIVLFELLSRWTNDRAREAPSDTCFVSSSECAVLHGLLSNLERELVVLFDTDYANTVAGARERLSPYWDGRSLRPVILR